jgi:hypothetical protein
MGGCHGDQSFIARLREGRFPPAAKGGGTCHQPGAGGTKSDPIALREAESKKRNKYGQLLAVAQEHLAGEAQVQLLTFGFSLQGTLNPGAEEVIKWLKEASGKRTMTCGIRSRLVSHVDSGRCRPL